MSDRVFVTVKGHTGFNAWIQNGPPPKSFTGEVVKFYDDQQTALVKRDSDGKLIKCEIDCLTVNQDDGK